MKGIVFNLLEQVVVEAHGDGTWDALLEAANLDGAYTSLGTYPDEELFALVGAASTALALPPDDVVRWFGRSAMPLFAERYPQLFDKHSDALSFVLTLNDIIHPEVRKLYPGAIVPQFGFRRTAERELIMDYSSPRRLCSLAEGLLQGAGDHYEQSVAISQPQCMYRGDEQCRLVIAVSQ